jgi:hypothetical protein
MGVGLGEGGEGIEARVKPGPSSGQSRQIRPDGLTPVTRTGDFSRSLRDTGRRTGPRGWGVRLQLVAQGLGAGVAHLVEEARVVHLRRRTAARTRRKHVQLAAQQ